MEGVFLSPSSCFRPHSSSHFSQYRVPISPALPAVGVRAESVRFSQNPLHGLRFPFLCLLSHLLFFPVLVSFQNRIIIFCPFFFLIGLDLDFVSTHVSEIWRRS